MTGVFNTPDPTVLAHEIGHAMGLGDDYFNRNTWKPEAGLIGERADGVYFVDKDGYVVQPGSFMTHGVGRPEPVHLLRVIMMMKEAGVLPPCLPTYLWEGRMVRAVPTPEALRTQPFGFHVPRQNASVHVDPVVIWGMSE